LRSIQFGWRFFWRWQDRTAPLFRVILTIVLKIDQWIATTYTLMNDGTIASMPVKKGE
jgi:hypothetical protein